MDIQTLGPQALLVYAGARELRRWGVNPRQPEPEALLLLSRTALSHRGISPRRLMEISALNGSGALLLLLRLSAPEEEWFPFPDLAMAVDAVAALPRTPEGVLAWDGRSYLLGTRRPEQAAVLSEYADSLSPAEAGCVGERSILVLDEGALGKLWEALRR